jgi:hypothetical protein
LAPEMNKRVVGGVTKPQTTPASAPLLTSGTS